MRLRNQQIAIDDAVREAVKKFKLTPLGTQLDSPDKKILGNKSKRGKIILGNSELI